MIVQRGDDEFHGVDARGGGLDGHHAISIDADVCGGGGTSNILKVGLMTLADWACAASGMLTSRRNFFFNVVDDLVSLVWMERLDVPWGFYTVLLVVVGTSVAPTQTRGFVSHWRPTILRIEAVPGCCEWPEGANARGAFSFFSSSSSSDPKNVSRFLGLFGKQGTGYPHCCLDVVVGQGFLGAFVDFFLDHLLRFAFDTACQPRF